MRVETPAEHRSGQVRGDLSVPLVGWKVALRLGPLEARVTW